MNNTKWNSTRYHSPSQQEATMRRSLEEISKDIKDIENVITATEIAVRNANKAEPPLKRRRSKALPNKENKTPSPTERQTHSSTQKSSPVTFKVHSFKRQRQKMRSPRLTNSKLYFRNGRIGCLEADPHGSNVQSTHALVKDILKYVHEKPLVSPESVRRVLDGTKTPTPHSSTTTTTTPTTPTTVETDAATVGQASEQACEAVVLLPGAVPVENDDDVVVCGLNGCSSGGSNNVNMPDSSSHRRGPSVGSSMTENTTSQSQALVDDDEQDVQICYDELPDILNDEQNFGPELVKSDFAAVEPETETATDRRFSATSLNEDVRDQVRHLVRRFTARANKVKSHIELPPTPSSSNSAHASTSSSTGGSASPVRSLPAALKSLSTTRENSPFKTKLKDAAKSLNRGRLFEADTSRSNVWICSSLCGSNNEEKTLDPQGKIYISWLCVVSISFLYNAWVIPLRSTFPFQTPENTNTWLICDFCADIIYLLDVIFFKHRIMYLFEGFWVKNKNLTRKNYMRKLQFKLDLLALLPLELFYLKYGTGAVYLRFPRLFKIQSFWEVFKLLDRVISSPHFVRVAKTLTYMLYMIHLTACAYYAYSDYQGLGVNRWVFSGKGHPYVRCFAFATKTATSIGKNPKPEREGEYVFMTAAWLMGVFVFALLIGQIRDIISTATRNKNEYRQLEDETLEYMRRLNLPSEVQGRVKMWFKFTWEQQRTLDEANILDSLPINLKTDIAIAVHIQTLSKVQLFADCEEALLRDLVLKLRAVTFLPGDNVCRKGEVGREMYIIKLGQVQVMGGPNSDIVLATLSEGSVFGEISLLGINGADRRTADVRSKGYANLFVLSKSDLNEVIAYYPNAQAMLKKRARALMRKNAAREREEERAKSALKADVVISNPKTPETPPKLLKTVIQALPYESPAVMLITRGSKRMRKKSRPNVLASIEDEENVAPANEQRAGLLGAIAAATAGRRANSPDLLSSIQDELKTKHSFINLTDSQKALIISKSNSSLMELPQQPSRVEQLPLRNKGTV
ncbi:PREDICTED: cyclic nucleotide-gated cation channel beta-3 [Bactrocera latifrons]|uniref:Cyclic nucleotide-gated cation channel beta-3 n=1 Tax=Bactrocera latifrons TaxID=174628 RepID=A0A0K8UU94_BACLA|nr:PREDICTED: cyclic nucleotide-gated cation channel beta-3 [Bactrocera latifrons]